MALANNLTEEHAQCIDHCLTNCALIREAIASNERAGIPMPDRLAEVADQEELARKIKAEKFPLRT